MAGSPRFVSSKLSPAYAPKGDQSEWEPLASIPQVEETWAYWDMNYGMQNEWGLSMGESTCTARTVGFPATPDKPYGKCHVGINDLSKIALERCKTARCAIQTMGDIAVEYGFFSEDSGTIDKPDFGDSAEALGIADADGEVWIFNVLTGKNNASAIWAAQRVPDDHVAGVGNSFTIRKMNLKDTNNFMYSPGVADLAIEMGWWEPQGKEPDTFDFFGSYGWQPDTKHMQNLKAYYSGRRMWRIFNMLSPEEGRKLDAVTGNLPNTKNPYPMSVRAPPASVTLEMVMGVHRDHYEGTPFDLTKGMAAGPFGNPNRGAGVPASANQLGQWERAISTWRTSWSFVSVARPDRLGVTWFGWDAPHGTAYLPIYASVDSGPPSFSSTAGNMSTFSRDVAWWAFNLINQYTDLNFQLINREVRQKASKIEQEAMALLPKLEAEHNDVVKISELSNAFVEEKVAEWWRFSEYLFAKYGRYVITHNESQNGEDKQWYPEWWMSNSDVGFTLWSPEGASFEAPVLAALWSPSWSPASVLGIAVGGAAIGASIAFQAGRHLATRKQYEDVYVPCTV